MYMADLESLTDIFPRHKEDNPYNYSNLEKAERSKALKDMERDYPNLPYGWLEMVYDHWKNTPKEEQEEIINSGKWEGKSKFRNNSGGVIQALQVLSKEDIDLSGNV